MSSTPHRDRLAPSSLPASGEEQGSEQGAELSGSAAALLARVRFDEAGIHGEYWENGSWIEHAPVADVLSDPSYSEEISSVKAHEIARSLGWDIGSDSGRSS